MKAIPRPRGLPGIGTILSIMASGGAPKLHLYVDKRHKKLGKIYREKIGAIPAIFISDANYMRKIFACEGKYPKHILPEPWLLYNKMYNCKRGLLFMDDEEWFHFRKTMNHLMLKVGPDEFYKAAAMAAENLIGRWGCGQIRNLESDLYIWSLDVITGVLLGSENYRRAFSDLEVTIKELAQTVNKIFIETVSLSLLPATLAAKLKLSAWKRFVKAADAAVENGKKMVEKLLEIESKRFLYGGLLSEMMESGMEIQDLRRIVTDLILAAGDTTAYTMQWFLYLLSMNASEQTSLFNEIQQCNGQDILKNPLLKGCLKETLRLYPVAPFLTRFMPQDITLDEYQIKKNELVIMSLYTTGRNENYFSQPNKFLPRRWFRKESIHVTNPNASLPFAMGSRSCIGKKIAEIQILVAISMILKTFEVRSGNKNSVDIILHLISVPSEPISIILSRRN